MRYVSVGRWDMSLPGRNPVVMATKRVSVKVLFKLRIGPIFKENKAKT